jgi:NAD(P)-dependent dehydrogenase (short-subunit alcohol dehydrogenase family)
MNRALSDQVVVITGASSGIGREAALEFGRHGSSVVVAARNSEALEEVARQVDRVGGRGLAVPTDVAEWSQVESLAARANDHFGRIDTWINNAAVSEYATVEQMTIEEIDRILRVNLLGQIYGVKAVLPHMIRQGGGTIINVGSALSERAIPLQSVYCASKHGLLGFSEALRLELARDHPEITVTLVMPSSINTPLFRFARSKMGQKPMPVPPIYEPSVVAEALAFAAENPRRDITVGGSGKLMTLMDRVSPKLVDWYMLQGDRLVKEQQTGEPDAPEDNLFAPVAGKGSTTGDFGDRSRSTSLYTRYLDQYPARVRVLAAAATLGALALLRRAGR